MEMEYLHADLPDFLKLLLCLGGGDIFDGGLQPPGNILVLPLLQGLLEAGKGDGHRRRQPDVFWQLTPQPYMAETGSFISFHWVVLSYLMS